MGVKSGRRDVHYVGGARCCSIVDVSWLDGRGHVGGTDNNDVDDAEDVADEVARDYRRLSWSVSCSVLLGIARG